MKVNRSGIDKSSFDNIIDGLGNHEGKIGWDESAVYPNGTRVAQVAAIQEFGDPSHNIPERSFIRSTQNAKRNEWKDLTFKLAKSVIKGQRIAKYAFTALVLSAEGDIVETISTLEQPPLKESTIKARLRERADKNTVGNLTKPLVDSDYMRTTLTSTVDGEIIPGSNVTRGKH